MKGACSHLDRWRSVVPPSRSLTPPPVSCEGKYPLATGLSPGTLPLCLIYLGLALGDTCEPLKPLCFSVFKITY